MSNKFAAPIEMGGYGIPGLGGTFGSTTALNAQYGKGYDYKAVIGWATGLQDESVWFCSELIAFGLIKASLMDGQKHVSPADLYRRFGG